MCFNVDYVFVVFMYVSTFVHLCFGTLLLCGDGLT